MRDENERPIDDERDPAGEVYDDEVGQGDLLQDDELEIYEDEEDLRRRSPHE